MTPPRTVCVTGFGNAFRDWGVAVLHALAAAAGETVEIVVVDPGQAPDDDALVVVFMDDVTQVLGRFIADGNETIDATRAATSLLASLEPSLAMADRLLIRRSAEFDITAACQMLVQHLLPNRQHVPAPKVADLPAMPPWVSLNGGQALALARQILAPMARIVAGETASIVLPLACFYSGNHPGEIAAPLSTLAGPRRPLYYGPYFHLPKGHWRVAVQLLMLDGLADAEMSVDVFAEHELARVRLEPREQGLFQITMAFTHDETFRPVEFRVWVERGAIEGIVGLRHMTLQRIAPEPGPAER